MALDLLVSCQDDLARLVFVQVKMREDEKSTGDALKRRADSLSLPNHFCARACVVHHREQAAL